MLNINKVEEIIQQYKENTLKPESTDTPEFSIAFVCFIIDII